MRLVTTIATTHNRRPDACGAALPDRDDQQSGAVKQDVAGKGEAQRTARAVSKPRPRRRGRQAATRRQPPASKTRVEIWLKYKDYTHFLQKFVLTEEIARGSFLVSLLEGIDELRQGRAEAVLTIHTQLLEDRDIRYETENFISKSNLNKLFKHFAEMRLVLEIVASQTTDCDAATMRRQTRKLLRLLDED